MTELVNDAVATLTPDYLPVITVLVVVACLAVGVVMLLGGGDRSGRSMNDVYARRDARRGRDAAAS